MKHAVSLSVFISDTLLPVMDTIPLFPFFFHFIKKLRSSGVNKSTQRSSVPWWQLFAPNLNSVTECWGQVTVKQMFFLLPTKWKCLAQHLIPMHMDVILISKLQWHAATSDMLVHTKSQIYRSLIYPCHAELLNRQPKSIFEFSTSPQYWDSPGCWKTLPHERHIE